MAIFVAGPVSGSRNGARLVSVLAGALCYAGYVVLCQADYGRALGVQDDKEQAHYCLRQSIAALSDQATALAVTAGWRSDATARTLTIVAAHLGLPCFRLHYNEEDAVTLSAFTPAVSTHVADGEPWDTELPTDDAPLPAPSSVAVTPRHIAVNDPLPPTARPDYDAVLTDLLTDMRRVLDDTVAALAVRREAS